MEKTANTNMMQLGVESSNTVREKNFLVQIPAPFYILKPHDLNIKYI